MIMWDCKLQRGGNGAHGSNVEIIANSGFCKVCVSFCFESEGQIAQPLIGMVGQGAETNISVLF
jgi:hypothetical protein